jgi:hypothetical protein
MRSRPTDCLVLAAALVAAAGCGDAPHEAPAGASAPVSAAAPSDAPRLVFREPSVSFGTKYDDETADVTIAFRNDGGRTLHVNRIDVDCACARLGEQPSEVAPGATAELRLRLKFTGVSGPIRHRVAIDSDDPATPIARAWMTGEIVPRLAVEPRKVEFRPATMAEAASIDLDVRAAEGGRITDLVAFTSGRALAISTTSTDAGARVRVAVEPFADDFLTSVVLRRGGYERVIPVRGFAARDVRAVPEELTAGLVKRGEPFTVRLVGRKGVEWRVKGVTCDRADLSAALDGDALRVSVGEKAPAGPFTGAVVVELEGATPSRVRVMVRAVVRE